MQREALPWWIFAVLGGAFSAWIGPRYLGASHTDLDPENLPIAVEYLNWAIWSIPASGRRRGGWLVIHPVNAILGWLFRAFNRMFDRVTEIYGLVVGKILRQRRGGCGLRRPFGPDLPANSSMRPRASFPSKTRAICS